MKIVNGFQHSSIEKAATLLKDGELVVFPTETVYGLGADALNPTAVARIFELKKRPRFDPLIVHIAAIEWIDRLALDIPARARSLMERFWPGPLTVILKKQKAVPDIVTAGLATVGIRMPSHPVALDLIRTFGSPVAAPSANPFGYMSPTKADHVAKMFGSTVPLILDGGPSNYGIESTIISVRDRTVFVHRNGAIPFEEIEKAADEVREREQGNVCEAPGELPYHYAPHARLKIVDSQNEIKSGDSGFLAFKEPVEKPPSRYVRVLSTRGDLREAASHFFSHLIELDQTGIDIIYAEKIPEVGLGRAMMERLRKAARKREA
jgi:L-threonylcarbamoyladenylate synthase